MRTIKIFTPLIVAAIVSTSPSIAGASEPTGPIRIIVGYAPGGAADSTARIYAEQLRADGAGTVIVENKPGASNRVAVEYMKNAKPDGQTIFLGPSPLFTIFPLTYRKLTFDPDRDFVPVASLVDIPTVIAASVNQPYKTLPEYIEQAKANPALRNVGYATLGSAGQLGFASLSQKIGVNFAAVGYKGASPMLVDLTSGTVPVGWDAAASMLQLYKGGKIRLLGISGTERSRFFPEVPTVKELGYDSFQFATSWYGVFLPKGATPEVVERIEKLFRKASANRMLVEKLDRLGLAVAPAGHTETQKRIQTERNFWKPIVTASGLVIDE